MTAVAAAQISSRMTEISVISARKMSAELVASNDGNGENRIAVDACS